MKSQTDTSVSRCRTDVLCALDRVLEEQPDSIEQATTAAIQCLVRLRDQTIAAVRARDAKGDDRKQLHRINAALSLLLGAHYPLVGIQWDRLKQARQALTELAAGPEEGHRIESDDDASLE